MISEASILPPKKQSGQTGIPRKTKRVAKSLKRHKKAVKPRECFAAIFMFERERLNCYSLKSQGVLEESGNAPGCGFSSWFLNTRITWIRFVIWIRVREGLRFRWAGGFEWTCSNSAFYLDDQIKYTYSIILIVILYTYSVFWGVFWDTSSVFPWFVITNHTDFLYSTDIKDLKEWGGQCWCP